MSLDGGNGFSHLPGALALVESLLQADEGLRNGRGAGNAGKARADLVQPVPARREMREDGVGDRFVLPVEVEAESLLEELADGDAVAWPDLALARRKEVGTAEIGIRRKRSFAPASRGEEYLRLSSGRMRIAWARRRPATAALTTSAGQPYGGPPKTETSVAPESPFSFSMC